MKIAASIVCYNEDRYIRQCIRQMPEWVEKVLVLESELPWNGHPSENARLMTNAIKEEMKTDKRVEHARLNWNSEESQRNWGLGRLYDYDWVLIIDADEFYTPEDWEVLRADLEYKLQDNACGIIGASQVETYWKDFDHVFSPADSHVPYIAVKPRMVTFCEKRCVSIHYPVWKTKITMYHLSWVKNNYEVQQKIQNWAHANDFDRKTWYDSVWLRWTPENAGEVKGLRPYGIEKETISVRKSLPDSIRALFG